MTVFPVVRGNQARPHRISRSRIWRHRYVWMAMLFYTALIIGGHWAAIHVEALLSGLGLSQGNHMMTGLLVGTVAVYIIATALPFVPGAEIGFALIMILGSRIVPVVYLATIAALLLSFAVGRHVPEHRLASLFSRFRFVRSSAMLRQLSGLQEGERVLFLARAAPAGWLPWLVLHRYWALIVLINLPGNSLLGGGGGIAMLCGISRTMSLSKFMFCVMLAVSPVPLAAWFFGN
jgi:hypothetical protein